MSRTAGLATAGLCRSSDGAFLAQALRGGADGAQKTALARQIDATDRQIDRLVQELYGLTDGEIRIVEEATGL